MKKGQVSELLNVIIGLIFIVLIFILFYSSLSKMKDAKKAEITDQMYIGVLDSYLPLLNLQNSLTYPKFEKSIKDANDLSDGDTFLMEEVSTTYNGEFTNSKTTEDLTGATNLECIFIIKKDKTYCFQSIFILNKGNFVNYMLEVSNE